MADLGDGRLGREEGLTHAKLQPHESLFWRAAPQ